MGNWRFRAFIGCICAALFNECWCIDFFIQKNLVKNRAKKKLER
jgi:hypothetical protein